MATNPPPASLMALLRVRVGLEPDDESKDVEIGAAYVAALTWLENYLDRYLEPGTYTETFTHVSANVVSLKGYPVETINTITPDEGEEVHYHLERTNGLLHFDGYLVSHELVIEYDAEPVVDGALLIALLGLFDVVWATFNTGTDQPAGSGAIKAITSDGARVEFDVSSGSSSGFGSIDPNSGMPVAIAGMLYGYKRWNV